MSNFKFPYFSRNIGEFWRRWHISLSSWFRDYVYIPLGGSKGSRTRAVRNIFIIFLISGFWHGANWTFIFWGLFHAVLFIPLFVLNVNRKYKDSVIAENSLLPSFREIISVIITFVLVTIGWVFFRSENLSDSFSYLLNMFEYPSINISHKRGIFYVLIIIMLDYFFRKNEREVLALSKPIRYILYIIFIVSIVVFFLNSNDSGFIYFQF
jgi:D-alanyl-lipoteichoic acid acyltransferase DltB (MBOAT superfamily)